MTKYIKNIKRIEFTVTYACNSRCRHCLTVHRDREKKIDASRAAELVTDMAAALDIQSVMTFGGEPLLHLEAVKAIHQAALQAGIPHRQLITNGGIWAQEADVDQQAAALLSSGINEVLLSVDTFHMEFIPLTRQHAFAKALKDRGFGGLRLNPVWVLEREDNNIFNMETEECLKIFEDLSLPAGEGNRIIPEGNAKKYLKRFYKRGNFDEAFQCGDMPYTQRLDSPEVISVEPGGEVAVCGFSIGNIYEKDIMAILEGYDPYKNPMMAALLDGGLLSLQRYAREQGLEASLSDCYTPCEFCRKVQLLAGN